ncbi:uncharacterized protein M421DRAFT_383074 [Didymella exigua CBS 183.55]|uniref:Uncharacterized protein n=1 Tax=Didymella exigua CBS 183.55 TaxID=1150837 RepID=A0A6A5RQS0_9PLEO|nr:uncharacterized protein M421DRAFT_383074 [Didymella exigua CBS 183.55]KAF1930009.1 hypothetical protein M421DRAFT_383074 [Didymella exigua CBS 183.55]
MSDKLPELQLPSDTQDDTGQREELKTASIRFLVNVKARFGEHSFQVFDVHKTLDLFRQRALSKHKTHKIILDTLEGHNDLRQELMDILMHPAARWGPGDFDLPTQHSTQVQLETAPQYLQPAHELRMRLPSFSSWFTLPHNDQSASLMMFNDQNGFGGQQSLASSPSPPIPPPFKLPDLPTRLWTDIDTDSAYTNLHVDEFLASPVPSFRNPWGNSNRADNWMSDDIGFPPNNTNIGGNFDIQGPSTLPFHDQLQAPLPHPHHAESYTMPTSPQQETSHSLYTSHPTRDTIPSPIEQDTFYTVKLEEHTADLHAPPTPTSWLPPNALRTEDVAEIAEVYPATTVDRSQSLGGPYIHILCGKGFSTLTGAKKHHWGKKVNDLATTTGCWAKHKKPGVAWDDHPSCKDGRSTSVVIKPLPSTMKQSRTKASISQSASSLANDAPQVQPLSEFPTLEGLPHTVARTVQAENASTSYAQEPKMVDQTHRLASRSSFDSLLTAINVVSQIDAPKPKGRANSIALHLDVQVAAAEQRHSFIPYEPPTSLFNQTHYGAIAPAAFNTTGSTDEGEFSPHTSGSHVNYIGEEQPLVLPSDIEEPYTAGALLRPFQPLLASSSGPARKKRKV